MMTLTLLAATMVGVAAAAPVESLLTARAAMPEAPLTVGEDHEFTLTIEGDPSWSPSGAGVPDPLVQIKVPPSVELTGRVLDSYREQAQNEFIVEPFERLATVGENAIGFRLVGEPGEGETIGVSIIAYLSSEDGSDARFLRKRLELPVRAGATAEAVAWAEDSSWSSLDDVLDIGDRYFDVSLPDAEGNTVTLSQLVGDGSLIVTTYRAFW